MGAWCSATNGLIIWALVLAGQARGADSDFCRRYALAAVKDNLKALRLGCRLRSARWHGLYQRHYQWCQGVTRTEAQQQAAGRHRDLKHCRARIKNCTAYARQAVKKQRENLSRGCGFKGGRWHATFRAHYDWCWQAGIEQRRQEHIQRKAALQKCLRAKTN